ncbi:28428_t:CDS:2 [Gigaspora margarita]|uniref:28428_t:CDS:1 n=1 Tax=Gigaspora margarita TaxID=4874 RepID=A0ABN7UUL4_GIGMA|nr:28428_t:CDS:2 [Gigaspora margarita]
MPKHEFLTPKAIANRIKAKGLQKLKWYCQMCQKQCRDENGYQCHIRSESHLRQMDLLKENPSMYMQGYSKQFHDDFIKLLSRRWGTKRVHANLVYQEYISDRHHVHMNGTIWDTLTDFVKHLGREGTCSVDETPKGWFISWIDNTIQKKERAEKGEEERARKLIEEQIERAQKEAEDLGETFTELKRSNEEDKIKLNISLAKSESSTSPSTVKTDSSTTLAPSTNVSTHTSISFNKPTSQKMSLSALAKKSGSLNVQKKDKEKEQPKKLTAMEQIIIDDMARKKRKEIMNENENKRKEKDREYNEKRGERDRSYDRESINENENKRKDREYNERKDREYNERKDREYNERKDREYNERKDREYNERKDREYNERKDREYNERRERDRSYDRENMNENENKRKDREYNERRGERDRSYDRESKRARRY